MTTINLSMHDSEMPTQGQVEDTFSPFWVIMLALFYACGMVVVEAMVMPEFVVLYEKLNRPMLPLTHVLMSPVWLLSGLTALLFPLLISFYLRKNATGLFFMAACFYAAFTVLGLFRPLISITRHFH